VTARLPPRAATWLIERLGSAALSEALIGDLVEQFTAGRSRSWYWRQAIGALAPEVSRALRTHALSFTGAVIVGCAFSSLWQRASAWALRPLHAHLESTSAHPWSLEGLVPFFGMLASAASSCALSFLSVWIVARIHRVHRRAVLVVFVMALTAQHSPAIMRLAAALVHHLRVTVSLNIEIVMTALQAVFTLAAGLWLFRNRRFADLDRRTRFVSVAVVVLVVVASVLYSAWRIGALAYSRAEGYLVDAAEIATAGYLTLLLWRLQSASRATNRPVAMASGGARSAATALR